MKSSSFKRILSIVLVLVLTLSLLPAMSLPTAAATFSGSGTSNSPYEIKNAADWSAFCGMSQAETRNKHFKLVCDISTTICYPYPFEGHFDGGNHTVKVALTSGNDGLGLFRCLDKGGTIKNVIVTGSVTGTNWVGGIAGWTGEEATGSIEGCVNMAEVRGTGSTGRVGGIVGYQDTIRVTGNLQVKNCVNTGKITGFKDVGGIIGLSELNKNTKPIRAIVDSCYNTGAISTLYTNNTDYRSAGGIVGAMCVSSDGAKASYKVTNSYNTGPVSAYTCAGGIVGYRRYGGVENCYNTGAVYAGDNKEYGGISGYIDKGAHTANSIMLSGSSNLRTKNEAHHNGNYTYSASDLKNNSLSILGGKFSADTNDKNNGYPTLTNVGVGLVGQLEIYHAIEGGDLQTEVSSLVPVSVLGTTTVSGALTGWKTVSTQKITLTVSSVNEEKGVNFAGWYVGDEKVSTDRIYSFIPLGDSEVTARFKVTTYTFSLAGQEGGRYNEKVSVSAAYEALAINGATTSKTLTLAKAAEPGAVSELVLIGKVITLTATAEKGYSVTWKSTPATPALSGSTTVGNVTTATLTMPQAKTAVWAEVSLTGYTLTLDPNGGTLSGSASIPYTIETGDIRLPEPTRAGYTFNGWADSDGNIIKTFKTSTLENVTLTAVWGLNTYNIVYHTNGGEFVGATPPNTYSAVNTSTLPDSSKITRTGHTFGGWYTDSSLTGSPVTEFPSGDYGDKNVYAKWTPVTYTITFDSNGGSECEPITVTFGQAIGTLPTPADYTDSSTNYYFNGWFYSGTPYTAATVYNVADNITLTAGWKSVLIYTATFTDGDTIIHLRNESGQGINAPTPIEREGYTFKGWLLEGSSGTVPAGWSIIMNGNYTYTAVWEANEYTITIDANSGTVAGGAASVIADYGTQVTLPSVTREGYTFTGWLVQDTGRFFELSDSAASFSMPARNVTIEAQWSINSYELARYDVIQNPAGTYTAAEEAHSHRLVEYDTEITTANFPGLDPANAPTMAGYTFKGWYTDKGLTQALAGGGAMPASDVAVYAKWDIAEVTVTAYPGGQTVTTPWGVTFGSINGRLTVPTPKNHIFAGWYTDDTFETPVDDAFVIPPEGMTVTAKMDFELATVDVLFFGTGNVKAETPINYQGEMYNVVHVEVGKGGTATAPTIDAQSGQGGQFYAESGYALSNIGGWYTTPDFQPGTKWDFSDPVPDYTPFALYLCDDNSINTEHTLTYTLMSIDDNDTITEFYTLTADLVKDSPLSENTFVQLLAGTLTQEEIAYIKDTLEQKGLKFDPGMTITDACDLLLAAIGYCFEGWYSYDGSSYTFVPLESTLMPAEDLTLYAILYPKQYIVSLDTDGGTVSSEYLTAEYGSSLDLPTPARAGYEFDGWYITEDVYVEDTPSASAGRMSLMDAQGESESSYERQLIEKYSGGSSYDYDYGLSLTAKWKLPSSSGSGSDSPNPPTASITVDGKEVDGGKVTVTGDTTTVTVNQDTLNEMLGTATESVTISAQSETGSTVVELVLQNLGDMEDKELSLIIQVGDVQYEVPAGAIDTVAILEALGAAGAEGVQINITITTDVSPEVQAAIENAIAENGGEIIIPPIEFKVTATYNGQTVEISTFGQYVSRSVEVTEEQAAKITTAVVIEPDGTVRHVPTYVYEKDGKWYYAVVNSLTNSTYALIHSKVTFADAKGKWYEGDVNEMGSRMIISGVGDNLFAGERDITRAEFAAIVMRALGLPEDGDGTAFSDVPASAWFCGAVGKAYEYGIVSGIGGGKFAPDVKITRQEAMLMIQRSAQIAGLTGSTGSIDAFSDAGSVSDWALEAARWNVGSGLVVGSNGMLRPLDNITRAETATLMLKLLQKAGLVDVRTPLSAT